MMWPNKSIMISVTLFFLLPTATTTQYISQLLGEFIQPLLFPPAHTFQSVSSFPISVLTNLLICILHPELERFPDGGIVVPRGGLRFEQADLLQVVQGQNVLVSISLHAQYYICRMIRIWKKNIYGKRMTAHTEHDMKPILLVPAGSPSCKNPGLSVSGRCCRRTACRPAGGSW